MSLIKSGLWPATPCALAVLANNSGELAHTMPKEYLSSPLLFVSGWSPETLRGLIKLADDTAAMQKRALQAQEWYVGVLRRKVAEMGTVATRARRPPG